MTWHTFTLTRAQRAAQETELQMAFDLCFAAAAGPDDMALLTADGSDGERRYYASPGMLPWAANLLNQYGALPCAPPAPAGLRLVVGHQGDIEELLGLR
jgi:hypothetical protein